MEKRILIVEDFESIRMFLQKTLASKGYEVLLASDGKEALTILESEEVKLIISDYNMPKMNGMELLMAVKKSLPIQHIPVIFLTTEKNSDKKRAARDAGLFAWVEKPYKLESFLTTIERGLAHG